MVKDWKATLIEQEKVQNLEPRGVEKFKKYRNRINFKN